MNLYQYAIGTYSSSHPSSFIGWLLVIKSKFEELLCQKSLMTCMDSCQLSAYVLVSSVHATNSGYRH